MSRVRQLWLASLLLPALLAGGPALPAAETTDLPSLLPSADQMPGWRMVDAPRNFKGEDLFDLIDGGADLYLEYGFSEVVAGRYEGPSSATLQIEIYRMRDAAAAFGVFSITQSGHGVAVEIGQAARLSDYYLVLWKGPCCVSVTATGPSATVRSKILQAARLIAARIEETGTVPALIGRLPREGLRQEKYFRGNLGLSSIYPFGADNPFQVQEGVCGYYRGLRLFIFRYPNAERAAGCLNAAGQALAPPAPAPRAAPGAPGFEYSDHAGNRIRAHLEGDCIIVRIEEGDDRSAPPTSPSA